MKTIQHSFAAGEFSPAVQGRSDLDRYDMGAAKLHNFIVQYGGGIAKREGTYFAEFLQHPGDPIRQFAFKFSQDLDNTYSIIFGKNYIRFMRDAGYVLEASKAVTSVTGGDAVVPGHGFSSGDWVYFSSESQVLEVRNVSGSFFRTYNVFGQVQNLTQNGGTVARVLTLANPYSPEDFYAIAYSQDFNQVKFTHPDYPPQVLTRTDTGWTLVQEVRNSGRPRVQTPTITDSGAYIQHVKMTNDGGDAYNYGTEVIITDPTGSGFRGEVSLWDTDNIAGVTVINGGKGYTAPVVTFSGGNPSDMAEAEALLSPTDAGFIMAVSAIFANGQESGITRPAIVRNSIDFSSTKGSATYSWSPIPGAVKYNVYRSLILPDGDDIHLGYTMGYIGSTRSTKFTDNNIVPDFTRTPKLFRDPFADGALLSVEVLTEGSGYSSNDTMALSGGGTGFVGYPIVQDNKVIGVYIANHGSGYSDTATLTVVTSTGSGATFKLEFSKPSGNYPAASFKFQRRYGYAGTKNEPMTVWASRVDDLNFATGDTIVPSDPYEHTVDADEVAPIRHALPVKAGLMLFTPIGVALLRGSDGRAVSATEGFIDPQSYVGASTMRPALVEEDIAFVQEKNRGLQLLSYEANSRQYQGAEISLLARHLFKGQDVKSLCFTWASNKVGYGVFEDGTGFALTIIKEQRLFAFTTFATRGNFKDAVALNVGAVEHVYFQVEREINGKTMKMIEVMRPRENDAAENFMHLDSCVETGRKVPNATLKVSALTGDVELRASQQVFVAEDVGSIVGYGEGRALIKEYLSRYVVLAEVLRAPSMRANEQDIPRVYTQRSWYVAPLVTRVSGIPFEGETVTVMVDGKEHPDCVVTDGAIDLVQPAAVVYVGYKFKAQLRNLPPTSSQEVIEFTQKNVVDVGFKLLNSGPFEVNGYDVVFREDEPWFEPSKLAPVGKLVAISGTWDETGQIELLSENGLPLEIVQVVYNVSTGD